MASNSELSPEFAPLQADKVFVTKNVQIYAMTSTAATAVMKQADAQVAVAKATHETPARQESVRVATVVVGIVVLVAGHLLGISDTLLCTAIIAVGGIYGIPKAIEKARGPKALPPPE